MKNRQSIQDNLASLVPEIKKREYDPSKIDKDGYPKAFRATETFNETKEIEYLKKVKKQKPKYIGINIEPQLYEELVKFCSNNSLTKTEFIISLIKHHLK
jgi:hypothetical protein